MLLTFDRLSFQQSKSEEQLGSLSDVALSTLFSNPIGSCGFDFLFKLTLDLEDDLDINKRSYFR